MTHTLPLILAACLLASGVEARAQVTVDRRLVAVYGQVITQSDVYQALEMRWVPAGVGTFDGARRELENRLLILREAARVASSAPTAEATAVVRRRWEAAFGADDRTARLERAGVTEAAVDAWCRETATLEAYLERRFGGVRESERPAAIADWIGLLRERAGLPR
jgi:hypothetical protein